MKNLIYLFLTVLIVACGSDDSGDSSSNSDGIDYFFEVELGGVVNRVEGNSYYEFPNQPSWILANKCYGSTASVNLSISDITGEDYVSGQNMSIGMVFDNAQLGTNNGNLGNFPILTGFYITEYLESLGIDQSAYVLDSFVENGPISWTDGQSERGKISNINITDLGTPSTQNVGTIVVTGTIKGTYESSLYFSSSYGLDYDIPVPIRIEFNAVRYP
jgi:hypothetical protein